MRLANGPKATPRVPPVMDDDGVLTPFGAREVARFVAAFNGGDRTKARAIYTRAASTSGLGMLLDLMDDAIASPETRGILA